MKCLYCGCHMNPMHVQQSGCHMYCIDAYIANEPMDPKEKAFGIFYESDRAQEFCFGNHNNSTRDEKVGEFSFNAGWNARNEEIDKLKNIINLGRELVCVSTYASKAYKDYQEEFLELTEQL